MSKILHLIQYFVGRIEETIVELDWDNREKYGACDCNTFCILVPTPVLSSLLLFYLHSSLKYSHSPDHCSLQQNVDSQTELFLFISTAGHLSLGSQPAGARCPDLQWLQGAQSHALLLLRGDGAQEDPGQLDGLFAGLVERSLQT